MINDILTSARVQMLMHHPFFANVLLHMKYIADETIETACTNGVSIRYNPKFIESLSMQERLFVLAHEVMHVAMLHHTRRGDRDSKLWNEACDYAVNQILKDGKFTIWPHCLLDEKYKGMSAEEIYKTFPPPMPDNQGNGKGNGNGNGNGNGSGKPQPGDVDDAPCETESQRAEIEAKTKQIVAQSAMIAKQQGKLPANMDRFIEELLTPKINWHEQLRNFMNEVSKNDYSFRKPSSRYIASGLYLPSMQSINKGDFVLIVDTSGSIDVDQLNSFASEMQGIMNDAANKIIVIFVDACVQAVQEFENDEQIELHPKGGGGTCFKPGFEYINENNLCPSAIIYFTDGYCTTFPADPGTPTLWALNCDNDSFSPPFGEIINIE